MERVLAERQTGKGAYTVPGELIPMSRSQKVLGERMTKSFRDIPQFSLAFRVEMDYALSMLERFSKGKGVKITLNSLIIRAAAMAFSRCPEVLRQIRGEGLFQPAEVNIGIAVAAGGKIVVPVIRNADRKRLTEIAGEAAHYIGKARNGTLQLDDVSGGTATVTNLGMFGITSFVPLVNPGESVILGVGSVQEACRAKRGSAEPFHFAQCTLVCDHRSVNGELAARFCRKLARLLETEKESAL